MTITHHGHTYVVTELQVLEQAIREAGGYVPKDRRWLQYHVDHRTPLSAVLIACGVSPVARAHDAA